MTTPTPIPALLPVDRPDVLLVDVEEGRGTVFVPVGVGENVAEVDIDPVDGEGSGAAWKLKVSVELFPNPASSQHRVQS